MEETINFISTEIQKILDKSENDLVIKNIGIRRTQVNYLIDKEQQSLIDKELIKIFIKIHEYFIKSFSAIKFEDLENKVSIQVKNIKQDLNAYKHFNEEIKLNINYPNNKIGLEQKTQEKIYFLYKKYIKEYKNSNKEFISHINYFFSLFKSLFEKLRTLSETIIDNRNKFEDIKNFIKNVKEGDPKVKEAINRIYQSYRNPVESFNSIDEFFFRIRKTKEEWEKINIFNRLEKIKKDINNEISRASNSFSQIENYFPKIETDISQFDQYFNMLKNNMDIFLQQYQIEDKKLFDESKIRIDILIILDTTNSMGKYLKIIQMELKNIIEKIKKNCPLLITYVGFIGYKDFGDLLKGDEYTDIDLTLNYNEIYDKIKDIEVDGGNDIPEDVAGAFKMALEKSWGLGKKISFLITDSPCHGLDYHDLDQTKKNYKDDYPSGFYVDEQNEPIEEFIRQPIDVLVEKFAERDISLVCLDILKFTEKMFDKFKQIYDHKNKSNLFSTEKGEIDEIIIRKSCELYNNENEIIDILKKKYFNSK